MASKKEPSSCAKRRAQHYMQARAQQSGNERTRHIMLILLAGSKNELECLSDIIPILLWHAAARQAQGHTHGISSARNAKKIAALN
jgi:hypothetical protein